MAKKKDTGEKFTGHFNDKGQFIFDDRAAFDALGAKWAGVVCEVRVEPEPTAPSDRQRKWYFSQLIPPLAEEVGYDREEHGHDTGEADYKVSRESLHYGLLAEYGGHVTVGGISMPKITSWYQLGGVHGAWQYLEWAVRFAAKNGVLVRFPSELEADALAAAQDEDAKRRKG